ncbi:hypothetical protein QBC46DRAFT_357971 [Diplogelasinospora grovesii]|uniref:C2H2-type domain-containing protein n=1 Tax=Diplogelasinospora grovesii TaxID=303347 RepID=A0AAN6S0C2_9PEZI|nr:hypothetical protein QBC46DRAFT_357971 [Diplogelasinospora grovesii]
MEPQTRPGHATHARVSQKLGRMNVATTPLQIRHDSRHRKNADAILNASFSLDTTAQKADDFVHALKVYPADALSLSGTTPPTSPTASVFPLSGAKIDASPRKVRRKWSNVESSRLHHLSDSHSPKDPSKAGQKVQDAHDSLSSQAPMGKPPIRGHSRGLGSIDSILTSTTCVNTHSECSRPESRLSQDGHSDEDSPSDPGRSNSSHPAAEGENTTLPVSPRTPRVHPPTVSEESDREASCDETVQLIDGISRLVLRNTWCKDLGDCAAPHLIWDCTYRYLEELGAAAYVGRLGITQAKGDGQPAGSYGGAGAVHTDNRSGSNHHNGDGKGKRRAEGDDGDSYGDQDGDGDQGDGISIASYNHMGKSTTPSNLSCPYRKRNPLRFNVRDHEVCATRSFADMSLLKKHIRAHHPPIQRSAGPFPCPRCREGFSFKEELDRHLRQPDGTMCRIVSDDTGTDPEDGITEPIITALESRSYKLKIDNWNSLWKVLFPADNERQIPDPTFIPVMEIHDFVAQSKQFLDRLKDLLEIQYRHVLEGVSQPQDTELKLRQGLEKSTNTIYLWIEHVVQSWQHAIAGAMSFVAHAAASTSHERWNNDNARSSSISVAQFVGAGPARMASHDGSRAPMVSDSQSRTRRYIRTRARKFRKGDDESTTLQPATQIPVLAQRNSRTPELHGSHHQQLGSSRQFRPLLPDTAALQPEISPNRDPRLSYHDPSREAAQVGVSASGYDIPPFISAAVFPSGLPTEAASRQHLEGITSNPGGASYLSFSTEPEFQAPAMFDTLNKSPYVPPMTRRISADSSCVMRDETRDSSQTLVEAHPAGPCQDMYCVRCTETTTPQHGTLPSPHYKSHVAAIEPDTSSFPAAEHPQQQFARWLFNDMGGTAPNNAFGPQDSY